MHSCGWFEKIQRKNSRERAWVNSFFTIALCLIRIRVLLTVNLNLKCSSTDFFPVIKKVSSLVGKEKPSSYTLGPLHQTLMIGLGY